ncbi:hypothetical protein BDV95DRAFT_334474 [Massariosphaeria phaeospora]|uniref:Uncharacterized protein n=1 Tax=Massariosphaeria phaeospora TaxID=100035 RepID=A0A7C8IA78_9PLEO|nr:hypothetical protein BDV95DRAFT_334474 [Massariosphaeria phaeospora]
MSQEAPSRSPIFPVMDFPSEIVSRILDMWIGEPTMNYWLGGSVLAYRSGSHSTARAALPLAIWLQYTRLLQEKWLRSPKSFDCILGFITVHMATLTFSHEVPGIAEALNWGGGFPQDFRPIPAKNGRHGLEKISLDLCCDEYFILFEVRVPPFDITQNRLAHDALYESAIFLEHTQELTLNFGDAYTRSDTWYNISDDRWDSGARPLPNVGDMCLSAIVIDWILSYAWANKRLQHISSIKLEGSIQPWVLKKWTDIFQRHRQEEDFEHKVDLFAIQTIGLAGAVANGEEWEPAEYYPPICECEQRCGRLGKEEDSGSWSTEVWSEGTSEVEGNWDFGRVEEEGVTW